MTDPRALCLLAGFDPDDPRQWSWWAGLSDKDRQELADAMGKGKMPTFTDLGVHAGQIKTQARPRR